MSIRYIQLDTFGLQMLSPWNNGPSADGLAAVSVVGAGIGFAVLVAVVGELPSIDERDIKFKR